jgi:hypothetical protein
MRTVLSSIALLSSFDHIGSAIETHRRAQKTIFLLCISV